MTVDDARLVENLIYRYAERIDAGDFTGVAALFEHGRIMPAPGVVVDGPIEVQKLYEATTRLHGDGTPRTQHVISNVVIEFDGAEDTARARSYFTVLQQTEAVSLQPIIAGRYHDTFHKMGGQWFFDTRTMLVDLKGDLRHHLLFDL